MLAGLFCILGTPSARAGLSLDEALARSRVLGDGLRSGNGALMPVVLVPAAADGVAFAIGGPGEDVPPLLRPESRGDGGVQLRAHTSLLDDAVQLRFGAAWRAGDSHPYTFDESSFSTRFFFGSLYASVERRHWGPAWTNSLILDAGAQPVPTVGWRKADPKPFDTWLLSWIGPWNADFFAGRLDQRIGPLHPYLLGARVQFMPIKNLELGISRTAQWGGGGRPETLKSFVHAVFGAGENVDAGYDDSQEPGNQLAGFDGRYTLRLSETRSLSLYMQAIGEDEVGYRPSHYLATVGGDAAFRVGGAAVRAFAEYADTACSGLFKSPIPGCAYQHHIYSDGYTQLGAPLGHPVGGDIRLLSIGAYVERGDWSGALIAHRGTADPSSMLYKMPGRLLGLDTELAWRIDKRSKVGLQLAYWNDPLAGRVRGQLYWQLGWP